MFTVADYIIIWLEQVVTLAAREHLVVKLLQIHFMPFLVYMYMCVYVYIYICVCVCSTSSSVVLKRN